MTEIVMYTARDGQIKLDVSLAHDTVWLSMAQMVKLFNRDKSVISRHLSNVFKINELDKRSVVAKFATTASDGKSYQVEYYNLDVIISVGYRVNSIEGVQFRQWATSVLKDHLIRGYTTYDKRLSERGIHELQQTVELLQKTLVHHDLVNDIGQEAIQLILSYAKTWDLLIAYDEGRLRLPEHTKGTNGRLNYQIALSAINSLKIDLGARDGATHLFGQERDKGLDSILKNIEQTFDNRPIYQTPEEKAAHLLYFIIKDHPFVDGNKRIGCLMFLLYLKSQGIPINLNDNGLAALALLVAESNPHQKEMMVRLVVNLLTEEVYIE